MVGNARRVRLLVVLASAWAGAACGKAPPPAEFAFPPVPVTVSAAVAKAVPVYLDAIGRCAASAEVTITPEVSGRIRARLFADGSDVAAEAPLFSIDARPFEARLAEAKARATSAAAGIAAARAATETARARVGTAKSRNGEAEAVARSLAASRDAMRADVSAAEAESTRAAADAKRMESMSGGEVSRQEAERSRSEARAAEARLEAARRREAAAEAQAAQAEAAVASAAQSVREAESQAAEAEANVASAVASEEEAKAAVDTARLDVERCSLRAPIAGRAGRRLVDVGDVVAANATALLSIRRLDPIEVEFAVPERDFAAVQRARARREVPVEVALPEAPGDARTGALAFVDNAVTEGTGTVRMRAKVENADGRFWPGRFARVRVILDVPASSVLVPVSAAQAGPTGTYVLVVGDDLVAAPRPVTLGQAHDGLVVVATGLAPGERVVVTGSAFPGARVRLVEPTPPGAPAGKGP